VVATEIEEEEKKEGEEEYAVNKNSWPSELT
jgi:hypothetical protein